MTNFFEKPLGAFIVSTALVFIIGMAARLILELAVWGYDVDEIGLLGIIIFHISTAAASGGAMAVAAKMRNKK